jgi:lysophospholipid acyltransferase (LPLAT)-like uncharacterized protein
MLFLPAYTHVQAATVLVSRHRDGELIAQLLRMLRGHAIRGSTDRGGVAALRQMMRHSRYRHLALAVDGPRGPRRVIPPGAIYLASRTGMPIIPVGMAYSACWRANSWDRTAVPKPFSRARLVLAGPIEVPPDAGRDAIESRRLHVQAVMDQVQSRAESLAANGAAAGLITLHQLRQLKPRYPTAGP